MKLFKRKSNKNNIQVTFMNHLNNDEIVTKNMDQIEFNNFVVYEYIGDYTILEVINI